MGNQASQPDYISKCTYNRHFMTDKSVIFDEWIYVDNNSVLHSGMLSSHGKDIITYTTYNLFKHDKNQLTTEDKTIKLYCLDCLKSMYNA